MRRASCIAVAVGLLASPAALVAEPGDIEGSWVNGDGDGLIELVIENGELQGRIVGRTDDPDNLRPPRLDDKNPDPALRSRKLIGLVFLSGFRYDDGRWTGGRIYDPNSGNTYRGTITVIDRDTLSLRGYVGLPLFGRSDTWKRHTD